MSLFVVVFFFCKAFPSHQIVITVVQRLLECRKRHVWKQCDDADNRSTRAKCQPGWGWCLLPPYCLHDPKFFCLPLWTSNTANVSLGTKFPDTDIWESNWKQKYIYIYFIFVRKQTLIAKTQFVSSVLFFLSSVAVSMCIWMVSLWVFFLQFLLFPICPFKKTNKKSCRGTSQRYARKHSHFLFYYLFSWNKYV